MQLIANIITLFNKYNSMTANMLISISNQNNVCNIVYWYESVDDTRLPLR